MPGFFSKIRGLVTKGAKPAPAPAPPVIVQVIRTPQEAMPRLETFFVKDTQVPERFLDMVNDSKLNVDRGAVTWTGQDTVEDEDVDILFDFESELDNASIIGEEVDVELIATETAPQGKRLRNCTYDDVIQGCCFCLVDEIGPLHYLTPLMKRIVAQAAAVKTAEEELNQNAAVDPGAAVALSSPPPAPVAEKAPLVVPLRLAAVAVAAAAAAPAAAPAAATTAPAAISLAPEPKIEPKSAAKSEDLTLNIPKTALQRKTATARRPVGRTPLRVIDTNVLF